MPCSAIATARARLVTDLAAGMQMLFYDKKALTVHAALVQRALQAAGLGETWPDVYEGLIVFRCAAGSVALYADGRASFRFRDAAASAKAEAAVRVYCAVLAQAKAKAALAQIGKITGEQRLPNGAVVLSLEV
jgi:hypothetical protein